MNNEKGSVKGIGRERSQGRGTSVTFRLRPDEIEFLKSVSDSDKGITSGIRKVIMFGRAAGNLDIRQGIAAITYALLARVEKLENDA